MNNRAATQTIVGPVGVLQTMDASNPPMADITPMSVAIKAMDSGVLQNARAVAAGMISMAEINKTPTTLIATATTTAKASVKINCSRFGLMPLA